MRVESTEQGEWREGDTGHSAVAIGHPPFRCVSSMRCTALPGRKAAGELPSQPREPAATVLRRRKVSIHIQLQLSRCIVVHPRLYSDFYVIEVACLLSWLSKMSHHASALEVEPRARPSDPTRPTPYAPRRTQNESGKRPPRRLSFSCNPFEFRVTHVTPDETAAIFDKRSDIRS